MKNIIRSEGPDQFTMPKIDAYEAGTIPADRGQLYAVRGGVGRVRVNKFGGKCRKCNKWVAPQVGLLTMLPTGKFGAMHRNCNEA